VFYQIAAGKSYLLNNMKHKYWLKNREQDFLKDRRSGKSDYQKNILVRHRFATSSPASQV
jgi:hypothetical protein